jgi:hypothetical protein
MMEFYQGTVLANWAFRKENEDITWDAIRKNVSDFDPDWPDRFHLWEYIWNNDSAYIYMDSLLLNSIDLEVAQEGDYNPFRSHDHYMLINQAIGGNQGGDPSDTEFPMYYEVDYVRVYQWSDEVDIHEEYEPVKAVPIRQNGRMVSFHFPPHSGTNRISIHHGNGRLIQQLEGEGNIKWDASLFEKGVYLIQFNDHQTRKFILM